MSPLFRLNSAATAILKRKLEARILTLHSAAVPYTAAQFDLIHLTRIIILFIMFFRLHAPLVILFLANLHASFAQTKNPSIPADITEANAQMDREAYDTALPLCQALLQRYDNTPDTNAWIQSLSNLAVCYDHLRQFNLADSLHIRAVALLQQKNIGRWQNLAADVYMGYGVHYALQRRGSEGFPWLEKARQMMEGIPVQSALKRANLYQQLALTGDGSIENSQQLAYAYTALQYYQQSGVGFEKQYKIHLDIANYHYYLRDGEQALHHVKLVELWIKNTPNLPKDFNTLDVYNILCKIYGIVRDFDKALQYARQIEYLALQQGRYRPQYAYTQMILGTLYMQKEDRASAVPHFLNYIEVADSIYKHTDNNVNHRVIAMYSLAICYEFLNKSAEAEKYWEKSIPEAERLGDQDILTAIYTNRGLMYSNKGQHGAAVPYFQKALLYTLQNGGASDRIKAVALAQTATAMTWTGDGLAALPYAEQALRLFVKPQATHFALENIPDSLFKNDAEISYAQIAWLKALLAIGKQTSDVQYFYRAWQQTENFIRLQEKLRTILLCLLAENYEWLQEIRLLYGTAVDLACQLAQSTHESTYVADALRYADRHKALILLEKSQEAKAKHYAGIPDTVLTLEASINNAIAEKESAYDNQIANTPEWADASTALTAMRKQKEAFIENLERQYPAYYRLKYALPSLDVQELRRKLPNDALFVEYFIDDDAGKLYIFTIDKQKGEAFVEVPFDTATETSVNTLRQQAQSILLTRPAMRQQLIEVSFQLYQQLLQPIQADLVGKKHLIIVPDAFLHGLPFELLVNKDDNLPFEQLPFLLKQTEVSYQYSATLFLESLKTPSPTREKKDEQTLLAFAPIFKDPKNSHEVITNKENSDFDIKLRAFDAEGRFTPLPYSEEEVHNIAAIAGKDHSKILLLQQATEKALKTELQKPHRMVHVATHSFANLQQPRFSGIACSYLEKDPSNEDGVLYVNEIYNLSIPAELVVLSSCESGLGKTVSGEGMLGLNRAFAYAGVHNIVYSLWKVNDKAVSGLMTEFYKHIFAGKSYAAALRAAKLKLLNNPTTASPNFWAGFLLIGM